MRKVTENDVLELWGLEQNGRAHMIFHDRQVQDARSKMFFTFLQHLGVQSMALDMAGYADGKDPPKRRPVTEVVMYAAELVDAAWNEAQHRGWIVNVPSYGEIA